MNDLNTYKEQLEEAKKNYIESDFYSYTSGLLKLFRCVDDFFSDDDIIINKRKEILDILIDNPQPINCGKIFLDLYLDNIFDLLVYNGRNSLYEESLQKLNEKLGSEYIMEIIDSEIIKESERTANFINSYVTINGSSHFIDEFLNINIQKINLFELSSDKVFSYFLKKFFEDIPDIATKNISQDLYEELYNKDQMGLPLLNNIVEVLEIFKKRNINISDEMIKINSFFSYYDLLDINHFYISDEDDICLIEKKAERYIELIMNSTNKKLSEIYKDGIYSIFQNTDSTIFYPIVKYAINNEPEFINELLERAKENKKDNYLLNDVIHINNEKILHKTISEMEKNKITKTLKNEYVNKNKRRI